MDTNIPGSSSADQVSEENALDQMYAEALKAFQTSDLEGVLNHWAEDGAYMWPAVPPAVGKEAIRAVYVEFFEKWEANEIYRPEPPRISGDLAYRRFSTDLTLTPKAGGESNHMRLNGVHVYSKQADGSWKFSVVIAIDAP
jgi:uncharacterized protein (TIGR02246 family)